MLYQPIVTPLLKAQGYLKLEYKQAGGSYKIRGLHELLKTKGVPEKMSVLSAGNMARTLLMLAANKSQISVFVPSTIPRIKEQALCAFPCELIKIPMKELWELVESGVAEHLGSSLLVHPIDHEEILQGYSKIADEIVEQLPTVTKVYIPFGVGGLYLGVSRRLKALNKNIKVIAVESSVKHPLHSHFTSHVDPQTGSWVDAIGTPYVLTRVTNYLRNENLVDDIVLVDPEEAKTSAKRFLLQQGDMLEGAAALALKAVEISNDTNSVGILTGCNVNPEIYNLI